MYTIKLEYITGDSFSSEETYTVIGHCWKDIELARKALATYKEHYGLYSDLETYSINRRNREDIDAEAKEKEWFQKADTSYSYGMSQWYHCLAAEMDDGQWKNLPTPHVGHFERLQCASVVLVQDEDRDSFVV